MIWVIGNHLEFETWRRQNRILDRDMRRIRVRHIACERDARGLLRPPGQFRVVVLQSADMQVIEYLNRRGVNTYDAR